MTEQQIDSIKEQINHIQINSAECFAAIKQQLESISRSLTEIKKDVDELEKNISDGPKSMMIRLAVLEESEKRREWWVKTLIGSCGSLVIAVISLGIRVFLFN